MRILTLSLLLTALGSTQAQPLLALNWKAGLPPAYPDSTATGTEPGDGGALNLLFRKTGNAAAIFATDGAYDLTGAEAINLKITNPGPPLRVAVALSTGGSWEWQATPDQTLGTGLNVLSLPLKSGDWKAARSDWKNITTLAAPGDVKRVALVVSSENDGQITLNSLSWGALTAQAAPTPTTPNPTTPIAAAPLPVADAAPITPPAVVTPAPDDGRPRPFTALAIANAPASGTQYAQLDLNLTTDGRAANPYDPAQADLWLSALAPSGGTVRVPAFYMQDYDAAGTPTGSGSWHARFAPTETGAYTLTAQVGSQESGGSQGSGVRSAPVSLQVSAGSNPGFVRVSRANPRYFGTDDGQLYLPTGPNIGWSTGADVLADYRLWFDHLAAGGGNFARIWMASWSFAVEWKDTGLGDYGKRQKQAWMLDQVFRMAEQRGIRIELTLINHGAFSETTNPEWADNPYNAANGGPLKTPGEFVSNPEARRYFQGRIRYLAARYGASTSLFSWEWWNEENFTPISEAELRPWIADMTATLRTFDPYNHLVASSFSGGSGSRLWGDPSISYAQQHLYTNRDLPQELTSSVRQFQETVSGKPLMLAEIGYSAGGGGEPLQERIHFHNSLWTPLFLGYAGSGSYWWWDSLIEPQNLWTEYQGVSTFFRDVPLASLRPVSSGSSNGDVIVRTLRSGEAAAVWLLNSEYSASGVGRAQTEALLNDTYAPSWQPIFASLSTTVTVRGLKDGQYTARWYDPQTAKWLNSESLSSTAGVLSFRSPAFSRDLAVTLTRL